MKKTIKVLAFLLAALCIFASLPFVSFADGEPSLEIIAHNLSFRDNVYLMYAVPKNGIDNVKVLVWSEPQEEYLYGTQTDIVSVDRTESVAGIDCQIFCYTKLTARQMGDYVYARAYANVGGEDVYSGVEKYSILEYAYNKLGKTGTATTNQKLITLLTDMLRYGASAQDYSDYKTNRFVTENFYQVLVTGGTLPDGFEKGLYLEGETVEIKAPLTDANGKSFYRWVDEKNHKIGHELTQSMTVGTKNVAITADYREFSVGLEYDSNGDGTCCLLGMGDFEGTNLIIPRYSPAGDLVTEIDRNAFSGESITGVSIPMSIESIGNKAFNSCASLADVYFEGTAEEWEIFLDEVLGSNNAPLEDATVHTKQVTTYTVTFVDWDGTELKKETVQEGGSATAPAEPTRSGYEFAGWDKSFDNITENTVITATYRESITNPTFLVDTVNAKAGDANVAVKVSVKNNPGVSSVFLTVEYDPNALTLIGWEYNSAKLGGQTTEYNALASSPKMTWTNFGTANVEGDFTYATLYFNVNANAQGNQTVSVSYNPDDVYNKNEENIPFSIVNGSIQITK